MDNLKVQRNGSLIYVCFLCFSLLTIISTRVKYDRNNKKRNEEGLTPKQAELKELKEKIIYMKKNEIKNKDISEQLNIPVKTLERYITKFKKEGLL